MHYNAYNIYNDMTIITKSLLVFEETTNLAQSCLDFYSYGLFPSSTILRGSPPTYINKKQNYFDQDGFALGFEVYMRNPNHSAPLPCLLLTAEEPGHW